MQQNNFLLGLTNWCHFLLFALSPSIRLFEVYFRSDSSINNDIVGMRLLQAAYEIILQQLIYLICLFKESTAGIELTRVGFQNNTQLCYQLLYSVLPYLKTILTLPAFYRFFCYF